MNIMEKNPQKNKMRILHTADLHLREHEDERWKTLESLIQTAKEKKVDIFAVSGDLFDKGVDAEKLRPRIRQVLSHNPFKIVIIAGNHDRKSFQKGLDFGKNVEVMTGLQSPVEWEGIKIWGMPFEPLQGEELLRKLRAWGRKLSPECANILLFHGELLDVFFTHKDFGDEEEERYMPVKLSYFDGLPLDYVLGGHFHSNFDIRRLSNRGYFVYPGSPVSITQRELGQRKVNLFELGKPPTEFLLDTPHFEKVEIEFDPFREKSPLKTVEERLRSLHSKAKVILEISGFINGEAIGLTETQLREEIEKRVQEKCVGIPQFKFRDIRMILEEDLFRHFEKRLEKEGLEEKEKKQMRDIAIQAMMKAKE